MSKLKFVVMRGAVGFGDRLQCLLQAIDYAKKTKRYLVVDWRDSEWSHDQQISADYYFRFEGLKTFELHAFLSYYQQMQDELTVAQNIWKPLIEDPQVSMHGKTKLFLSEDAKILQQICNFECEDFKQDVVVYPGVSFRAFAYSDFSHIHLAPWIIDRMKNDNLGQLLGTEEYDVVHLRGGSKKWAGGDGSGAADYVDKINTTFPDLNSYLDHLWKEYSEQVINKLDPAPIFMLSDSPWLAEKCIERFKAGSYLSISYAGPMVSSGIHTASSEQLKEYNLSKIDINYEMIRDFAIMCNARHIIHDGISLFSKMANLVKSYSKTGWEIPKNI